MLNLRFTLVLAAVVLAGMSATRLACGEESGPPRAAVAHEGSPGFWFRDDVARAMLADLRELPLRRQELQLLEDQLQLREGQVDRLRQMVVLERSATEQALEGLRIATARASSAEASRDVWWRRPVVWVVVGVVATVLLEVAAVAIFEYVSFR